VPARAPRARARTANSSPLLPATHLAPLSTPAASSEEQRGDSGSAASPGSRRASRARARSWVEDAGLAFTRTTQSRSPLELAVSSHAAGPGDSAPLPPMLARRRARAASAASQSSLAALGRIAPGRASLADGPESRASSSRPGGFGRAGSSSGTLSTPHSPVHHRPPSLSPPHTRDSAPPEFAWLAASVGAGLTRPASASRTRDGAGFETEAEADALGLGLNMGDNAAQRGARLSRGDYFTSVPSLRRGLTSPNSDLSDLPPPYSPSRPPSPPRADVNIERGSRTAPASPRSGLRHADAQNLRWRPAQSSQRVSSAADEASPQR
jgi:hypothetical protein